MRKELYLKLCAALNEVGGGAIKHIDLWNHNVEFIEQEENWERPAVFVEFCPIEWETLKRGIEYRAESLVKLHIVTDWAGSSANGSVFREKSLEVFDLSDEIQKAITGMFGETFMGLELVESHTNHNHDDIVENVDVYRCVAVKLQK